MLEDLGRPGHYVAHGGRNVVVYIAREALDDVSRYPGRLHGAFVRGASAAILSSHLRALADDIEQVEISQVADIASATVMLVAACLTPSPDLLDRARPVVEATLLRQIGKYIELHLTEPTLSVDGICAFFKISRATLYRLFQPAGGVCAVIQERRLMRIHSLLMSETRPSLARLAEEHGFTSAAHFSRAFKAMFGYAPSELTAQCSSSADRPDLRGGSLTSFDRWMAAVRA